MNILSKNMANDNTKIFVDANILLEIVHERTRFDDMVAYIRNHSGRMTISPLTVHLVMHFGRQIASRQALRQLLSEFAVLPMTATETNWAFDNICDNDFEDALQLACAINGECDTFATLDARLAKRYAALPQLTIQLL